MADKFERRLIAVAATELRASNPVDEDDDDEERSRSITGYATRFNSLSVNLGGFREKIQPGAFADLLKRGTDTVCLWNHDPNVILGRTKSGTLKLVEDSNGLKFSCSLPKTQAARDLHESISRGDVAGCSFSFNMSGSPNDESWNEIDDPDNRGERITVRSISRIAALHDVGPVCYPAYPSTDVAARSAFIEQVNVTNVIIPKTFSQAAADAHNERVRRRRQELLNKIMA